MDDCIENDSSLPLNFLLLKSFSTGKVQCYKHPKFDFDTSVTSFKQIDVDTKEGIFESAVAFSERRTSNLENHHQWF